MIYFRLESRINFYLNWLDFNNFFILDSYFQYKSFARLFGKILVKNEITQAVSNPSVFMLLNFLDDVWEMAHY